MDNSRQWKGRRALYRLSAALVISHKTIQLTGIKFLQAGFKLAIIPSVVWLRALLPPSPVLPHEVRDIRDAERALFSLI
jgi:hypothetical protein